MKNIQEKLEKIVQKQLQQGDQLGYAISVELGGKSLLKHYSGNVVIDDVYYPVNAETPFDVASIAKQFVACCIAILACEKRLNLDDSVRIYLPEMKEYADKITIRNCISMTSGVRNIYLMKYLMSNSKLNKEEMFFRQEQPVNEAGNFNSYDETGYEILGHIVERLTGGNAQFAKQRIFEPLGMANTQGHGIMGGGGLTSTAEDLVKWHNCLMNKNLPGAPDGLFDVFFSSFTLNNGELCPYGFGFFYDENNRDIIWQYGDNTGWQSVIRTDLKKKLSVIVLTHSDCEPVEVALDLENAVISEFFDLPEQNNYKSAYFSKPRHISNIRSVNHCKFPNVQKQNPITEKNQDKYLGRYYSYEIDTYFDIVPNDCCFQMKYADKDGDGYINLLDYSDKNNLKMRTRGEWGECSFQIEFYGDENKIDFFTLREGIGHFYFVKCTAQSIKDARVKSQNKTLDSYEFLSANYGDIPEIINIYHSLIGTPGCTWNLDYPSKESAESDIKNESLYILKKDKKIIAVASAGDFNELTHLHWTPKKPCELARIGVVPEMQKQGIGTIILQNIIKTMKAKGYDGIRMLVSKTNLAALALYEKNGFEKCGEVFMFDIDFYCYQIKFN